MPSQSYLTPEDVREEISFIENLMGGLSSDDEYLQAILSNQRMTGMLILQMIEQQPGGGGGVDSGVDTTSLPLDTVGIATEDISSSSTGTGVFNIDGAWYSARVDPGQNVDEDDVIVVNGQENEVVPSQSITRDHLNIVSDLELDLDENGQDAKYDAYNNLTAEDGNEKSVNWGYPADSVAIYGISGDVQVAFKRPSKNNRLIEITQSDAPFSITGVNGLKAEELWYQSASTSTVKMNAVAVGFPEQ